MSVNPWMKFYPRDWRGDQALRLVSLPARGLWMEMLCVMHEASPYGHLIVGAKPCSAADLASLANTTVEEIQALLVELLDARVARKTRGGVIYSKRMIADDKRSKDGRKAKLEAIEQAKKNPQPSRVPISPPTTQKPETRAEVEGLIESPSTLCRREDADAHAESAPSLPPWTGPQSVWASFAEALGEPWCERFLRPCRWQDVPDRALIPPHPTIGAKMLKDCRELLAKLGLQLLEKAA
jgi:hypothetical protein